MCCECGRTRGLSLLSVSHASGASGSASASGASTSNWKRAPGGRCHRWIYDFSENGKLPSKFGWLIISRYPIFCLREGPKMRVAATKSPGDVGDSELSSRSSGDPRNGSRSNLSSPSASLASPERMLRIFSLSGGFHTGGVQYPQHLDGLFHGTSRRKWMITGGTPISGNLRILEMDFPHIPSCAWSLQPALVEGNIYWKQWFPP